MNVRRHQGFVIAFGLQSAVIRRLFFSFSPKNGPLLSLPSSCSCSWTSRLAGSTYRPGYGVACRITIIHPHYDLITHEQQIIDNVAISSLNRDLIGNTLSASDLFPLSGSHRLSATQRMGVLFLPFFSIFFDSSVLASINTFALQRTDEKYVGI